MKVKNIMFSGFAAAILMGTVSANAAVPFQIASKAYVDGQTKMTVNNVEKDVTEVVADLSEQVEGLTGSGDGSVADQISDAIGELGNDSEDQPYSDVADALADKADASALTALSGRVTEAEGDIDDLEAALGSGFSSSATVASAINSKQDKLGGSTDAGKVVTATAEAGTVGYTAIDSSIGAQGTDNLVTSAAVKAYVDDAIDGVTGDAGSIGTQISNALGNLGTGNSTVEDALADKQDVLVAGSNIQIAADGKTISATDTTYTAGTGITIDSANNNAIAVNAVNSTSGIAAAASASDTAFPTEKAVAAALAALLPAASTCTSSNNHCVLSVNKTNGALEWVDVTSPFMVE